MSADGARLSIDERIAFLEAHFSTKDHRPFSTKGRDYIRNEVFLPATGFRLVARDIDRLCDDCQVRAGSLVEAYDLELADALDEHASTEHDECGGLKLIPIIITVVTLPRQQGKTTTILGLLLSILASEPDATIVYTASAEDQADRIVEESLRQPIERSPTLAAHFKTIALEVHCPATRARLSLMNSAFRSIGGGSYRYMAIDEARDVNPRTFAAAVPMILAQGGAYCPKHPQIQHDGKGTGRCPRCKSRLVPWWPRIFVFSSMGVLDGSERDWFAQLVQVLQEHPEYLEYYHLFASAQKVNPDEKPENRAALEVLTNVPALRTYIDIELNNRARRLGETFVLEPELVAITDEALLNSEGSERPCVSYLDCSLVNDLTTWMVCEDVSVERGLPPWDLLRIARVDVWDPADFADGRIKSEPIQALWDRYMPRFPRLVATIVDTRGLIWAKDFALYNQRNRPIWGELVKMIHRKSENGEKVGETYAGVAGGKDDRDLSWQEVDRRIAYKKAILPGGKIGRRIRGELLGAQRVPRGDGTFEIRDANRKKSHVDVAEAFAGNCLLAYREAIKPRAPELPSKQVRAELARLFPSIIGGLNTGMF